MKYVRHSIKKKSKRINTTLKKKSGINLSGSIISQKQGWIVLEIHGDPFQRGFAHGYLLKEELVRVKYIFPFLVKKYMKVGMIKYLDTCKKEISPIIKNNFEEFYTEIEGISAGAKVNKLDISVDYLIAWNSFLSLYGYFEKKSTIKSKKDNKTHHGHCSAFIATGNATSNGEIVMAHSTHCDLVSASLYNIVLYITPRNGFAFCIQTCAGFIASGADFFISSSGIIGTETTISRIKYKPIFKGNYPYFCRIRNAIQYGKTLDDYSKIMLTKNSGDYANSWLFGDIKTNTIMLCEIGLKYHNIQVTKNGVFYGMNSAMDKKLRKEETNDDSFTDFSRSSGARNARLNYLLNNKYFGKINTDTSKIIIADHFDIFTASDKPGSRSICCHSYVDDTTNLPCFPHLAVDAKVCTSSLARNMKFIGIFGSSCGTAFDSSLYIRKNPLFKDWKPYLEDFPKREWVTFCKK